MGADPALVSDGARSGLHPPGFDRGERCRRCGADNPPWSAPSPLWNAVMRGGSINGEPIFDDMVCATCFMVLAEKGGIATRWRVSAEVVNVPLETVTPSGRVWDEASWLWVENDVKARLLGALDGQWRRLGSLGLGSGKPLVPVAKSMPHLIESKLRAGYLVWRRRDSDGSPEGGDACGSVHDSAGRQASPETGSA